MMVMNKELKELKEENRKGVQQNLYIYILIEQIVVVMAGDDGDEQRTERSERTEQRGFATFDVMRLRHTEHMRTRSHPHSSSS